MPKETPIVEDAFSDVIGQRRGSGRPDEMTYILTDGNQDKPAAETPPEYDEFRHHTAGAKRGILLIRSLADEEVLEGTYNTESEPYHKVFKDLGPDTNPSWITSRFAETAYDRELIDEREIDRIIMD
jgi:hypothetical protein